MKNVLEFLLGREEVRSGLEREVCVMGSGTQYDTWAR